MEMPSSMVEITMSLHWPARHIVFLAEELAGADPRFWSRANATTRNWTWGPQLLFCIKRPHFRHLRQILQIWKHCGPSLDSSLQAILCLHHVVRKQSYLCWQKCTWEPFQLRLCQPNALVLTAASVSPSLAPETKAHFELFWLLSLADKVSSYTFRKTQYFLAFPFESGYRGGNKTEKQDGDEFCPAAVEQKIITEEQQTSLILTCARKVQTFALQSFFTENEQTEKHSLTITACEPKRFAWTEAHCTNDYINEPS